MDPKYTVPYGPIAGDEYTAPPVLYDHNSAPDVPFSA
jgi:hypothetical protein